MIKPVALYEGVPVTTKTRLAKNLESIKTEFIKEKEFRKKIFFYKLMFDKLTEEYRVRYAIM